MKNLTAAKIKSLKKNQTICLKATKKNYELAINRSMSRDGGEFAVGSENGMILIKRTL